MSRTGSTALLVATLLAPASCGEDVARRSYDLIERFPLAEPRQETERVDFGSPDATRHLVSGWSSHEGERRPFVWATGERSVLRLFVVEPLPRKLRVRCWPLGFPGAPAQRVSADVNGHAIGEVTLAQQPGEYSWRIPGEALVAGENLLGFSYAYHASPSRVLPNSRDARSLAVAWEWLALEGGFPSAPPRVERGTEALLLVPTGGQIDYFVELRPGSWLSVESVLPVGEPEGAPGRLEVEVARDGRDERWVGALEPSPYPQRFELPDSHDATVARVSLRALPGRHATSERPGGFSLRAPLIEWLETPKPAEVSSESPSPERATKPPSVIVYVVDTLRADHLGAYGYPRPTTPRIDAFAREATLYLDARANSSWTRPAVGSILTGVSPATHGVNDVDDALSSSLPTLGELLGQAGYTTAAFVTNGNVGPDFGFGRGFESFVMLPEDLASPEVHQSAARLHELALGWLREQPSEDPFFLYLHATDPHGPYMPLEPFRSRFAPNVEPEIGGLDSLQRLGTLSEPVTSETTRQLRALYDAEIAFLDAQFGRLLEELRELGRLDGTLVVFLADHGEEFHDHGWWEHGKTLYGEQLHIPLIVRFPDGQGAGLRVEGVAEQIDVLPTVLEAAGVPQPASVEGSALSPIPRAQDQRATRALLNRNGRHLESLELGGLKLIEYRTYEHPLGRRPETELFDLDQDPDELKNLAGERPVLAGYLRTLIREEGRRGYGAQRVDLDDGTKERLRALGYLD